MEICKFKRSQCVYICTWINTSIVWKIEEKEKVRRKRTDIEEGRGDE